MADLAHGSDDEYDSDIELDYFHRTCVVKHTFGSNEWENKSFQALCLNGAQIHKIITREIICEFGGRFAIELNGMTVGVLHNQPFKTCLLVNSWLDPVAPCDFKLIPDGNQPPPKGSLIIVFEVVLRAP